MESSNRAAPKNRTIEAALAEIVAARSGSRVRLAARLQRIADRFTDRGGRTRLPKVQEWIERKALTIRRDYPWSFVYAPFEARRADAGDALIVTHELTRSGAPRIVVVLACIFRDAGYGVTVVTKIDGPLRHELVREGIRVVVDSTVVHEATGLTPLIGAVDFVFCNSAVTLNAVRVLRNRVPVFWYLHEVSFIQEMFAENGWLRVYPSDFASPYALWAGSELAAAPIRQFRSDVRVVPYGIDPFDAAEIAARDDGIVRIGVFASLEPRKGQDLAAAAVRSLPAADRARIRLVLFGRATDAPFASQLVTLDDGPLVSLGGELDTDAYRAALVDTDVVLMPSRDDTLPLVSIDALGARRILACTTTTGTAAYLTDGVDGFVSEPSAAAIAAMLRRVLAARSHWAEIGERGAAVHAAVFSKQAFTKSVLDSVRASIAA